MKLTIKQGLPQKYEWKVGDVFEWRGGLYLIKTVSRNLIAIVIVPAIHPASTPASETTCFSLDDRDMRLVTELKAII